MRAGTATNVFWSAFEAGTSAALSFMSAFVVARLVGPAEVGIGAAAVAVHVLLWVTVNALFADALVQRPAVDDVAASSAFWTSAAIGVFAAFLQAAAGWPLASAFSDARLGPMAVVLALPLPLVGAGGAIQGLLTRDRAYRVLAGRAVIGQGLGTLTGICAALAGAGAWALVLQQLVTSSAGALALLLRAPWRPRAVCHWAPVREMLRVGLPLTASTLVQHGRYRLFAVLIGVTAGAAPLGQVHMAFRLVDTVRELAMTALWRLMLPGLAERQNDLPALGAQVDRLLALSALVVFPLCGAMAVSVGPLVRLLLGPVWEPAGLAALPLLGVSAWLFLGFPAGVAVVARGKARYTLIAILAGTGAVLLGVLLLRPAHAFEAVLVWLAAQLMIAPYTLMVAARFLPSAVGSSGLSSLVRPIRAGLPVMGLAVLATAMAALVPGMVARLAVGAAVYLPGVAWLYGSTLRLRVLGCLRDGLRRQRRLEVADAELR